MLINHRRRKVPGLNATSTADISFILLVFFLVISSMDSNKGITKQLPPAEKNNVEQSVTEMDRKNVLDIAIAGKGCILVDGKQTDGTKLKEKVVNFVKNCKQRSSHVVNITMQPNSRYEDYFHVEDAVSSAYATLRNACAHQRFHKSYNDCDNDERQIVDKAFPQRVMESIKENGKEAHDDEL